MIDIKKILIIQDITCEYCNIIFKGRVKHFSSQHKYCMDCQLKITRIKGYFRQHSGIGLTNDIFDLNQEMFEYIYEKRVYTWR